MAYTPTPDPSPGLSISDVARRTGISVPTLRAWEARFGFPAPGRLPGGHRRYDETTVSAIARVAAERRHGLSLEAAVARARAVPDGEPSIFAGLRRAVRELPVQVLGVRSMLAISRAIEDECYARGERHVIFGAFQTERAFRRAAHRWRELGRTGDHCVVFAGFRAERPNGNPVELILQARSPVRREWAVVCYSPSFTACLAGWERPAGGAGRRRFEAIWSVEPELARQASGICIELVRASRPELATAIEARLEANPVHAVHGLRSATSLTNRVIGYLDDPATVAQ